MCALKGDKMKHLTMNSFAVTPFRAITLAFVMTLSSPVASQDRATGGGTVLLLDLTASERKSRGQLDACELTYLLAYEDYIYRNGAVTFLRGSMSFIGFANEPEKGPAFLFKVTAFDLVGETHKLAPLEYAYLSSQGVSYAGKEFVIGAAEDGGLLVGYEALSNFSLSFLDPVALNIMRKDGASDVAIPVDFMMHDPSVGGQYATCAGKLLDVLKEKFN